MSFDYDKDSISLDLLVDTINYDILKTIIETIDVNIHSKYAKAITRIIGYKKKGWVLFDRLLQIEIENTKQKECLFREESMINKIVSEFLNLFGNCYLEKIIYPCFKLVADICKVKNNLVESNFSKSYSKQNLLNVLSSFLSSIFNSVKVIPAPIILLCDKIIKHTSKKYSDSSDLLISGTIFLRFICPFILNFNVKNICDDQEHETNTKKYLILITKILQNLANGTICKEKHLKFVNDYLLTQLIRRNNFFDQILNRSHNIDQKTLLNLSISRVKKMVTFIEFENCVMEIIELLINHINAIKDFPSRSLIMSKLLVMKKLCVDSLNNYNKPRQSNGIIYDPLLWKQKDVTAWLISKDLREISEALPFLNGLELLTLSNYDAIDFFPELIPVKLKSKIKLKHEVKTLIERKNKYDATKSLLLKNVTTWTQEEVNLWLFYLELDVIIPNFQEKSITGSSLLSLKEKDLIAMDIKSLGIRKRLIKAINNLKLYIQ